MHFVQQSHSPHEKVEEVQPICTLGCICTLPVPKWECVLESLQGTAGQTLTLLSFCKTPVTQARGQGMGGGRGGRFGTGRGMGGGRGGYGGGRAPPRAQGWEPVDRSKQACVFFAQGKCTKGEACPFSHSNPAEGGYNQASVSAPPSQPQAAPGGRFQPLSAGRPLAHMPAARDGDAPQTEIQAAVPGGTNGVKISSLGLSGKGRGVASSSVAERSGPGLSSNQIVTVGGGTAGPAAVVGGAGKASFTTGRNGQQARGAASYDQRRETPGHTGIIALPDGGFVTRKRAAELQLGRDDRSATEPRHVRQRDSREQGRAQERNPASRSGNGGVAPGGRVSIMDRLGPAKQSPERPSTRVRVVAPNRLRPEVPGQPLQKREEPRQHTTPLDRPVLQTSSPSPLPRSRVQSSARFTRRTESGRGDGVSALQVTRPTAATQQQKSPTLDFKIPTLDEIKSRKAKAEGAAPEAAKKREGRPDTMEKDGQGYAGSKERKPDTTTSSNQSGTAVVSVALTPHSSGSPVAAEVQTPVVGPAPTPAPTAVQSHPPQLDAEDMDEFSEWL